MDCQENMAVMSNKTGIFSVIDGKLQKKNNLTKKTFWMPAGVYPANGGAGMTMNVGGFSH
jgi:hypothetical protein